MSSYVSFPGLNIGPIELNRVAFSIGKIDVNWYGVIIACGMALAVLYALWHAKMEGVKSDDVVDLALAAIIFGVLGARLYYVVMEWEDYLVTGGTFFQNLWQTFKNVINVPKGGLAIYGGIIGGFLACLVTAKIKKIPFPVVADIAGPAVFVGQILGRWGNFVNVEAFGGPTTLPWRMCSGEVAADFLKKGLVDYDGYQAVLEGTLGAHPTFLYESLWNLLGLVLLTLLYKKKKFHGQMFLFYITWYGFGRMLIEGLRTDSLLIGVFRVSQLVGAATFLIGAGLIIVGLVKCRGQLPVFAKATSAPEEKTINTENSEDETNGKVD